MKHPQLEAMLAESGLDPDDVHQLRAVLGPLAELAEGSPPPSAEILALCGEEASEEGDHAVMPPVVPIRQGRGRGVVAGALVLAVSGVGATGLSAAANTLPSPWQHGVSEFSRHYLPFDFPQPAAQLPHLARSPHVRTAPGHPDDARHPDEVSSPGGLEGRAEEPSRSLIRARPHAKGAPAWMGRHPSSEHHEGDAAAYPRPRSPGPSEAPSATAAPRAAAEPQATPSQDKPCGAKVDTAVPAKTFSPRQKGRPESGRHQTYGGRTEQPGGAGKGPDKGPDKGAGTAGPREDHPGDHPGHDGNRPDPRTADPVPKQGGPAVDGVTPDLSTPSSRLIDGGGALGEGDAPEN